MFQINNPLTDKTEKMATRDGYGQALMDIAEIDDKVVVLDADLTGSTKTAKFAGKYPNRFYNLGVAEQNLVGHAAGLAIAGLKPIVSSFAIFLTGRAWEIVRNSVAYPNLNVKLAATHAGITLGEDGASHQIIEDISIMRAIPNMKVIVPADYWQAYNAIFASIQDPGPVYIRLGRPNIPTIYTKNTPVKIGKGNILQEGKEVAFFAVGVMVFEAWKAAKMLEMEYGIIPYVVDMVCVKPIDKDLIINIAKKVNKIYTFEEHNVLGGFGSAVAEVVSEFAPTQVIRVGLQDEFGQSGTSDDLMDYYNLTANKITSFVKNSL